MVLSENDKTLSRLFFNSIMDSGSRIYLIEKNELNRLISSQKKFTSALAANVNANDYNIISFVQKHHYFTTANSRRHFLNEIYPTIRKQNDANFSKREENEEADEKIIPPKEQVESSDTITNKTPQESGLQFQADEVFLNYLFRLKHLQKLKNPNQKLSAVILVDSYSKKVFIFSIDKSKNAKSVLLSLQKFKKAEPNVRTIETDHGKEFKNKIIQEWATNNDIRWRFSKGKRKAFLVEQAIGRIKTILKRVIKKSGSATSNISKTKLLSLVQSAVSIHNRKESNITGLSANDLHTITSKDYLKGTNNKNRTLYVKLAQYIVERNRMNNSKTANKSIVKRHKTRFDKFIRQNHGRLNLKIGDKVKIKNSILTGTSLQQFANKGSEERNRWTQKIYRVVYRKLKPFENVDPSKYVYTVEETKTNQIVNSQFYRQELLYVKQ